MIETSGHMHIIDLWPSLSDFAEDLNVRYGTAKAMRRRGSIPPEYWLAVVESAALRNINEVSLESLARAVARIQEAAE